MKKGKSVKLNLYNPIKSVYGTVDSKNLKSVYINIQSWVTPKQEYDNWNRVVSNLGREIKHSVFESINQKLFQEKYTLQYNAAVESTARNLKETYHRVNGPDWPAYDTSDDFFDQLPLWVKQECKDFGIDWKKLSIPEIHDYTQLAVKHGYPVDTYYQYTHIVPNLLFINQHTQ